MVCRKLIASTRTLLVLRSRKSPKWKFLLHRLALSRKTKGIRIPSWLNPLMASSLQIVCLLFGCLTSQQHASVSQGRIRSDNFTCCHTEIEVADPTFYLTQSQYTDTGPTSPSADPITPGAWQGRKTKGIRIPSWPNLDKLGMLASNRMGKSEIRLRKKLWLKQRWSSDSCRDLSFTYRFAVLYIHYKKSRGLRSALHVLHCSLALI